MLSYEGLFLNPESIELIHSLETPQLDKVNDEIHCTFKYHPLDEEIFNDIVGKTFEVYLIGYANDGINSGFELSLPEQLLPYYINYDEDNLTILKIPHITASISNTGKACNTKNLRFIPLSKPIKVTGKFGFWIKEDNNEYVSFEPYLPIKKK